MKCGCRDLRLNGAIEIKPIPVWTVKHPYNLKLQFFFSISDNNLTIQVKFNKCDNYHYK